MKHAFTLTGEPLDSLPRDLAIQERQRQKALKRLRKLRTKAAAEIERLLEFMDASDLDPDLEETADSEPSLGWPITGHCGGVDDLEGGNEDDEPDAEGEPSLGSVGIHSHDQRAWAQGDRRDLEDEHDGAEPDECGEPSLGSLDRVIDQEQSWHRENPLSVDMEEGMV